MTRRLVIVGQAPSRSSDPDRPFSGRSGARLRDLLGAGAIERAEKRNLLPRYPGRGAKAGKGDAFPRKAASQAAASLLTSLEGAYVILVGVGVAEAFGFSRPVPLLCARYTLQDCAVLVIPHPSGVCRWWNDPANVRAARRTLRRFARG